VKKIGIIGYGRFGKVLDSLLSSEYKLCIYDSNPELVSKKISISSLEEVLDSTIVFIAVPIRSFENVIKEICKHKLYNTTIVDVCSVKMYPVKVMKKYLPEHVGIIASHPHFGPDSYSPFKELKMTLFPVRDNYKRYDELKTVFESKSIRIVHIDPEEHDKIAASSQGITHFIGRVLDQSGVRSTQINTYGFNELLGVIEQTCNDSVDLFKDLQKYNPYTKDMMARLMKTIEKMNIEIKEDAD
tara:strand:+ start:1169 stop:1897 length:729 start_codon:yes stop_codon:yes gene_type:complete